MVQFALFSTPIGDCGIAWREDVVVATHLPARNPAVTEAQIAARVGGTPGVPTNPIQRAVALIIALLEGDRTDLSEIVCDFGSSEAFAVSVYGLARSIPVGETTTYGALAVQLGDKQLARNVGRALGRNPLPIIVPCHRVVGADKRLVGFSAPGGLETKLKMLMIEGARIGDVPGLFDAMPMQIAPRNSSS